MTKDQSKICFVIAPIGEEGSDTRTRSDQILMHIIKPVAEECGYTAVRADEISEPGVITSQIIQHLVEVPLVVADLTGRNANVFYELAVRHAVRKPVLQMVQAGETIPFDVAGMRTIPVDHHDLDSAKQCMEELVKQIRTVEKDPSKVDSPVSVAAQLQSLWQSDNPLEKSNAEIISMLQDLRASVVELAEPRRSRIHPGMIEELVMVFDRLADVLALKPGDKPTKARFDEAAHIINRSNRIVEMLAMESGMPPEMFERIMIRRRHRRP